MYADELRSLLAAEGLETAEAIELSAGAQDMVFEIIGALGSVAGVTAAVQGFLNRHRDRVFRLRFGGENYEVKGCSPKQAAEFVAQAVRQAEEYEARWKEIREQE